VGMEIVHEGELLRGKLFRPTEVCHKLATPTHELLAKPGTHIDDFPAAARDLVDAALKYRHAVRLVSH
jgi:hypothetical protein